MENISNNKRKFIIMTAVFAVLVITIMLWAIFDYLNNPNKESFGVAFVALILTVFGVKFLRDKYESVKKGEPLKDERSRKIEMKAGALTFYISIYWLLALSIIIEEFSIPIPARSVPSAGLIGMVIIFGLSYLYFNKKGD